MGWGWGRSKAGWQAEATGGREGQRMPAHVSAGSEPARLNRLPAQPGSAPPHPVPPEAATPQSSRPVSCTLPPPLPAPQANHFPCSRENRGSFQSCSELDAFPRASWSVSRQPGLGREPHADPPPTSILSSGPPPRTAAPCQPFAGGSGGDPRPSHLSLRSAQSLLGPLPPQSLEHTHDHACLPPPPPSSLFPSPSLQPWPSSSQLQNTHTHAHAHSCTRTLMHKTNCGMFSCF